MTWYFYPSSGWSLKPPHLSNEIHVAWIDSVEMPVGGPHQSNYPIAKPTDYQRLNFGKLD